MTSFSREVQARTACAAPIGTRSQLPGITIEPAAASGGDLAYLRITDHRSGGWLHAYYDPAAEPAAWARAACIGAQIRLLDAETGGAWPKGRWSSVVFTPRTDYIPPRSASEKRWMIATAPDGTLTPAGQHMTVVVLPHEQVHAFQKCLGADTPRWFHEGHAQWISRKVVAVVAPESGRDVARKGAQALAESTEPVALARWGGMQVKPEAILRQVSPEERKKIKADPHYAPPRPVQLQAGRHGQRRKQHRRTLRSGVASLRWPGDGAWRGKGREAWVEKLTTLGDTVTSARIQEAAQLDLQEDLRGRLQ